MADKSDNWFGSWLHAAKNKSSEVLEFVKKDLEELSSVVKNEANSVVSSTGAVIEKTFSLDSPTSTASNMKRSISSFIGQMNTVLNPSPDDSDTEVFIVENSETIEMTVLQKRIYDLQKDVNTFICDPGEKLSKQYQAWLEIIDDQLSDDQIAKHVNSSEVLKGQYAKLVPEVVEHHEFWKRYLFKKALIEDEVAREECFKKREQKETALEEDVQWEKEDFASGIELTEEQQIKLLEQYEREKKNEKGSKMKKPIGEKILFKQESPKKNIDKNSDSKIEESVMKLSKNGKLIGAEAGSSSSSSTDGEWEKINEVEK